VFNVDALRILIIMRKLYYNISIIYPIMIILLFVNKEEKNAGKQEIK